MPIYEFYWGNHEDEKFVAEIEADVKTVEKLLKKYKASDEEYNDQEWIEFLQEKGIKARILEAEYAIYF